MFRPLLFILIAKLTRPPLPAIISKDLAQERYLTCTFEEKYEEISKRMKSPFRSCFDYDPCLGSITVGYGFSFTRVCLRELMDTKTFDPLPAAIVSGEHDIVKELLKKELRDHENYLPYAIRAGSKHTVQLLLDHNAVTPEARAFGLEMAIALNKYDIIRLLESSGARRFLEPSRLEAAKISSSFGLGYLLSGEPAGQSPQK